MKSLLNGRVQLYAGDCLAILPTLAENSVDSVCCDPPYHLTSLPSRSEIPGKFGQRTETARSSAGFMGKQWDGGDIAFRPETWAAVLRVLKPGGHLVAFAAPKNAHRMVCAIEDAGFEIRDTLMFLYGSGFPKNLNVSANCDRCRCDETRLAHGSTVSEHDVRGLCAADLSKTIPNSGRDGAQNLQQGLSEHDLQDSMLWAKSEEGCAGSSELSVEGWSNLSEQTRELRVGAICALSASSDFDGENGRLRDGAPAGNGRVGGPSPDADRMRPSSRPRTSEQSALESGVVAGQPQPQARRAWEVCDRCGKPMVPDGLGSHLKPAFEPICLARKPLSEPTIAANVLRWNGCGALNIDGCRISAGTDHAENCNRDTVKSHWGNGSGDASVRASSLGRWPANVLTDGSEEVVGAFPESGSHDSNDRGGLRAKDDSLVYGKFAYGTLPPGRGDSGSAARFFFTAKADAHDRAGSSHPTVKPLDLIQYLVRLVTPPRGTVLDCFAGTGTTGEAAWREGFSAILIEREPEYIADIERRMSLALAGPDERARESIKARLVGKPVDAGPLFGALA